MSRLPIRLRLALAFALVMGIVLAAMGAFVFVRVERSLTATVNRDLQAQLEEIRTHAERGAGPSEPLVDPETHVLSQFLDAKGRLLSGGGLTLRPLLSAAEAQRVIAGAQITRDGDVPASRATGDSSRSRARSETAASQWSSLRRCASGTTRWLISSFSS